MFWGPCIHWNTYLHTYVMVLNHAINTHLDADGIYISFNPDIGNPSGWSKPVMLIDAAAIRLAMKGAEEAGLGLQDVLDNGWYPQIIGTAQDPSAWRGKGKLGNCRSCTSTRLADHGETHPTSI
jgi:hypothetical protein